ncbi:MAG TPA: hypothetical protein VK796_06380 [Cytophaga sp.]|jgi:hypothetical protein|nr:hypothetical protein [Cytophaga sp.]
MNITEETIDSFLRGDLSEAEQTAFNKAVAADPKLQQEVSIQKDIIDSVKQYRHQQLKDRLNAVDIKPVGFAFYSSPYFKLAASIGIVALIVGSFSLFTNTETNENSTVVESSTTGTESIVQSNEPTSSIASANTNSAATDVNSKAENVTSAPVITDNKNITAATTSTTGNTKAINNTVSKTQKAPENTTYKDASEETIDTDNMGVNDNFDMPSMNHGGNASSISSPQIKVSIVKENNLGYRFFNNQLFLHGNFSNSTYELFELNNKPSKQLFLYFENNYYELIQGKTKVTALNPITDKAVLIQLTHLREH